jgi:c-di-GMP-binding flagellar brake protein YcgR
MPIVLLRCEVIQITHIGGTRNKLSLKFEKISEKNKRDIVMFLQEKQIEKARRKKGE